MTRLILTAGLVLAVAMGSGAQVSFSAAVALQVGSPSSSPRAVAIGDMDGDQDLDLVVALQNDVKVAVILNNGNGSFRAPMLTSASPNVRSVTLIDVENDGDLDVVASNTKPTNSISLFVNDGTGALAAPVNFPTGISPDASSAADLDRDGFFDLAVVNRDSNTTSVFLNNRMGSFTASTMFTSGTGPRSVAASDIDRDGDKDLVVANRRSSSIGIHLNTGNGSYGLRSTLAVSYDPYNVVLRDVDRDGIPDLLTAGPSLNGATVWRGDGAGGFGAPRDWTSLAAIGPTAMIAVDLTGDDFPEIILPSGNGSHVAVLVNDRQGGFPTASSFATGRGNEDVAAGDLDGDGDLDLVVASQASHQINVLFNTTSNAAHAANLILGGAPRIGTTVRIQLESVTEPAHRYVCGFALDNGPPIPIPVGRKIPLQLSQFLADSLTASGTFLDTQGSLGGGGAAYAGFRIPNLAPLAGITVYSAFVTLRASAPAGIASISPALAIKIQT